MDRSSQLAELKRIVLALEENSAGVSALKDLAFICSDNTVPDGMLNISISASSFPESPTPAVRKLGEARTIWDEEKIFNRMLSALLGYLSAERVSDITM